jgi:hypothetical protein
LASKGLDSQRNKPFGFDIKYISNNYFNGVKFKGLKDAFKLGDLKLKRIEFNGHVIKVLIRFF